MKSKLFSASVIFICLIFYQNLLAQNTVTITGKVISSDSQQGLAGVSVRLKGTLKGVSTDINGKFVLNVSQLKGTLLFSSVGFASQEVPVHGQSQINVSLEPTETRLQNVVVIGYGSIRKKDLTGSVSQVSSKEINAYPTTSVMQALTGKAAGVQVLQNTGAPGDLISVRIRGANSLKGNNEPLYVIDGFPTTDPSLV
ncbi:MAG TPA: carboxypeptidase-like regulatory domain-containing protein, partial [Mucilaginibacter sp.]